MGLQINPSEEEVFNLRRLCTTVLQPLRNELNSPITILSGLRPVWLNNAIGGSKNSAHLYGCAADIEISGVNPFNLAVIVSEMRPQLPFDQCILEFPPNGWVHIGIERVGAERRHQLLTAKHSHGKTEYTEGLHE
jgi:hypothetical protein